MKKQAGKKILICDDEEGSRESLKSILADIYPLILCADGEQCLDCLANDHQDIGLILLDIKMPKENGLKVLEEIRSRYCEINVVIVTGYKSVETATEAVRLGACGYIIKPFKPADILSVAKKNLG